MAYKVFSLSDSGELIINKIVVLGIPSFKKLLQRDKGSVGDANGRKKTRAFKELLYIYHMADYNSVPIRNGYNNKQSIEYAISKSGLPSDYVADELVKTCIKDYKLEYRSSSRETILELVKSFNTIKSVVSRVRTSLEKQLLSPDITLEVANDILNKVEFLINSSAKIPIIIKSLQKATTELELEANTESKSMLRGSNEEVPDSAEPKLDY